MAKKGSPYEKYEFLEQIGNGSFGSVHRARNKTTHRIVAVKIMKQKFNSSSECANLQEYKTLKHLTLHPNIVQLYDTFLGPTKELYFVMEFMNGGNLYQLMKERREANQTISHDEARDILRQILAALAHIHHQGIFHRDMKPENLLIGSAAENRLIIKLADFGLARELKSRPPYTEYVSTRWYRAPEVLLRSTSYSYPVDIWAVGAIFAEIITLRPLFPGQSEIDQLYRICELLGSPSDAASGKKKQKSDKRLSPGFARKRSNTTDIGPPPVIPPPQHNVEEWREGVKLAHKIGFDFPQLQPKPLESAIPTASAPMLDLLQHFLFFDPNRRIKARDALFHPLFIDDSNINKELNRLETTNEDLANENLILASPNGKDPSHQKNSATRKTRAKSSVTQDIKDVLRLAGGRPKDEGFQRKKSMTLIQPRESVAEKDVGSTPAFDLPSIPLSPFQVHSDWNSSKITSRQSLLREVSLELADTKEYDECPAQDERELDTDEPVPEDCLDPHDISYRNQSGPFDDIIHQLLKEMDTSDHNTHEECDITQRLSTKLSEPLLQMRYIRQEAALTEPDPSWGADPRTQQSRLGIVPNTITDVTQTGHDNTLRAEPKLSLSTSLSTPLESRIKFAHVNRPRKSSKPNDTKGFSRLFGLRKNSNASKRQPQDIDDITPSIARTESFPSALFKQFSSHNQGRAPVEVKQRRQETRRSSSMMLLSSSPPVSTLAGSKPKKLNRLSFWTKKSTDSATTFGLDGARPSTV
ncbi:hypothetical protein DFQ30_007257, partial [Apophysomyces sp. BC1015]